MQGLDYVHLFPIIQWLGKQAIQTREAEGDKVRQFAIRQYHKNSSSEEGNTIQNGIENVREQSIPKRLYRKKHDDDDPELTMLEYGQRKIRSSNVGSKNLNKENSNADDEGLISEPTTGHSELN